MNSRRSHAEKFLKATPMFLRNGMIDLITAAASGPLDHCGQIVKVTAIINKYKGIPMLAY